MLGFPFGTKLHYHLAIEFMSIISHYFFWWTILVDQVFLYKPFHHLLYYISILTDFYPFCEVIDSHKDKLILVAGFWIDKPNHINSPDRNGHGDVR